ncbi:YeiH family protein [Sphingomicrobium astaxanthinifaciens]|uniref:YeiH family protein n=1 Tax=Sphingomicrobium astaxanthinifaciens TaxID=1227949 RepID=UPI001FCA4A3C|nr:putative sulfate exporter family transporter [Sphingomicrobium astaxanthinifaciens]MCJ7421813.1 putative sulfate exporter family transporter [Sphingomicrobium astaxanthinifaciens]
MIARLLPGLSLAGAAALVALAATLALGTPLILMGLVLGLLLSGVAARRPTGAGLDLLAKQGLRLGIVLLGLQIAFDDIAALGWTAFAALLLVMGAAIGAALVAGRLVGANRETALLAGGGTAICGASAALAIHGAIGRDRISEAQFTLTLIVLAGASALAFLAYPLLAELLGFTDRQTGFLIGAGIHDAAQAVGAGFVVSDEAGQVATIVKMSRVALLAPLVALMVVLVRRRGAAGASERPPLLPGFILAFIGLIALNSLIALPPAASAAALTASKGLLLLAVTATALRTRLGDLRALGWRAALPVAAATLASLLASLAAARWWLG